MSIIMFICNGCNKYFKTNRGCKSHVTQVQCQRISDWYKDNKRSAIPVDSVGNSVEVINKTIIKNISILLTMQSGLNNLPSDMLLNLEVDLKSKTIQRMST